jgi:alkanesulfonate monooxygenase SsuD/methylene tetrahydromethanopterin reductase-like flavin-dependent oxidoreductase (luciferase family)
MVDASGVALAEFAAAIARFESGAAAEEALDDRFVEAFAVAGTAAECLARIAAYAAAGVGELALNFVGPEPDDDFDYFGRALAETGAADGRS